MSDGALSGRRVAVPGGAGFLGRQVVRRLEPIAAEVFVPRSRDYDLTQPEAVRAMYRDARPDVVIHLAARVGGIGANQRSPGTFFHDNLMMGALLIEEARRTELEKFVCVGTVCSYPKFAPTPFREDDLWNGYPEETNAPYGIAKKALLVQLQAYRQEFGMRGIYLIPVNLYGPGDDFDLETSHVIPALIRKCVEAIDRGEDRIEVWGSGSPTREFLYVGDAADAIVTGAAAYEGEEPVNLGSGREISIRELAALIARLTGFEGDFVWNATRPDGQPRRVLDVSRAADRFGWRARMPLERGLEETIAWYRSHRAAIGAPAS
ncbi:MAG TPA: GDP-L-fucose synthase [Actinomycetota bacterium]|nr:GDP-L-fucose synthase [Actinomycetota bacterium]